MIGKCRIIKSDLFDVSRRIKEIDSDYFMVYNYRKKRYEIHNKGQGFNTFCLTLGQKTPDARDIEHVRLTRSERSGILFEQMEKENEKLSKDEVSKAQKKAGFDLEEYYRKST